MQICIIQMLASKFSVGKRSRNLEVMRMNIRIESSKWTRHAFLWDANKISKYCCRCGPESLSVDDCKRTSSNNALSRNFKRPEENLSFARIFSWIILPATQKLDKEDFVSIHEWAYFRCLPLWAMFNRFL